MKKILIILTCLFGLISNELVRGDFGGGYGMIVGIENNSPFVVELESQENNHTNTIYVPGNDPHCTNMNTIPKSKNQGSAINDSVCGLNKQRSCAAKTGCRPFRIKPHTVICSLEGNEVGFVIPWQQYNTKLKLTIYNNLQTPKTYYFQDQANNIVYSNALDFNGNLSSPTNLYNKNLHKEIYTHHLGSRKAGVDSEDIGIKIAINGDSKGNASITTSIVYAKPMGKPTGIYDTISTKYLLGDSELKPDPKTI